jgi:tRNA1(Val) A37 N6-methylase TrmN6
MCRFQHGEDSLVKSLRLPKISLALRCQPIRMAMENTQNKPNRSVLGFEATLRAAADELLENLAAAGSTHLDYILANPPFNMSDCGNDRLRENVRWNIETPIKLVSSVKCAQTL